MKNTRRGLGKGLGTGYKNLAPMDSHIHSLSAKGVKSVTYSPFNYPKKGKDNGLYFVMSAETGDMKEIVVGKTNAEKKVKEWAKKTKQEMILAQQKGTAGLYAKGNVKFPIIIMNKDYDITIGESGEAQPQGIIIDVSSNDQDRDDPILDTYTIWYDDFDWDKEKALKFAKKKLVEDGYTLNAKGERKMWKLTPEDYNTMELNVQGLEKEKKWMVSKGLGKGFVNAMIKDGYGFDEFEKLQDRLRDKKGDVVDVNDYGQAKIVDKSIKGSVPAYLVIEEDFSVRYYVNPDDRSDTVMKKVFVKYKGER